MGVYLHQISPFAIRFTETIAIRWYGLAYLFGFLIGFTVFYILSKRGKTPLSVEQVADLITYGAVGILAGGRIGYCLFYQPDLLISFDSHIPFWGLLKVNEGGMSSHGGIMGAMLVCYFYGKRHHISFLHLMDLGALCAGLGFFFGRIANFINGELYGRAAPAGYRWAVKFPQEMYLWAQQQVSRLLDVGPAAAALGHLQTPEGSIPVDQKVWQGWVQNYPHDIVSRNAVTEMIDQIIAAIQAGNAKVADALAPVLTARYPSQLIQAFLEGFLVFVVLCIIWRRARKPGVLAAWFGILYAVARILGEQYRLPDPQIGYELWGLTRGQWLSIGMLAFGLAFLLWASRRKVLPMGGWGET